MELENRYFVVKITDFDRSFAMDTEAGFFEVLDKVFRCRQIRGKPPLEGIFIERDWPEYEPTKAALLARINGDTEKAPIKQWCSTLRRDCERNCPTACLAAMEDMRIGGPGSIDAKTLAEWRADANAQLEGDCIESLKNGLSRQRATIERIANFFKVMMCSAQVFTDSDGTVTGYHVNTGAAASMLAELQGQCHGVFIPAELPPSPMQHGARCWYAFVKQPELTNDELATIDRIESAVSQGEAVGGESRS